jgi:hypothetical protein
VVPDRRQRDRDDGAHTYVLRHAEVPVLLVPAGRGYPVVTFRVRVLRTTWTVPLRVRYFAAMRTV